jgi:hypothetical protein
MTSEERDAHYKSLQPRGVLTGDALEKFSRGRWGQNWLIGHIKYLGMAYKCKHGLRIVEADKAVRQYQLAAPEIVG